jgi:PBP1b-binding outer membrane lipoprotein LpoB
MKTIIVAISLLFITGCSVTTPVKRNFPPAPEALMKQCDDLKLLAGDKVSITDMLKVVVENYRLHYECSNKVEGWTEWYTEQKKIFEDVK